MSSSSFNETSAPPTRIGNRWVQRFRASNRLGAVLGAVLFAVIVLAAGTLAKAVLRFEPPAGDYAPGYVLFWVGLSTLLVLAATAIMGAVEGRAPWRYGLASRHWGRDLLRGLLAGVACLSLLVLVLDADGSLTIAGLALRGAAPIVGYGAVWLVAFILVAVSEEMVFRGYLQATLSRVMGFWPAALLLSCLFAATHVTNAGETPVGILGVFVVGLAFCLLLRVSGSLWLGIGFHAAWDWAQSYLYGTPDSGAMMQGHLFVTRFTGDDRLTGGTAGLEGSLLATPMLILGATALAWGIRRTGMFGSAGARA